MGPVMMWIECFSGDLFRNAMFQCSRGGLWCIKWQCFGKNHKKQHTWELFTVAYQVYEVSCGVSQLKKKTQLAGWRKCLKTLTNVWQDCSIRLKHGAQREKERKKAMFAKKNADILYSATPCHVILLQTKTTKETKSSFQTAELKRQTGQPDCALISAWLISGENTSSWDDRIINNPKKIQGFLSGAVPFWRSQQLMRPKRGPEVSSSMQFGTVPGGHSLLTTVCLAPTIQSWVSCDSWTDVRHKRNFWTGSRCLKKWKAGVWITHRTTLYHTPWITTLKFNLHLREMA